MRRLENLHPDTDESSRSISTRAPAGPGTYLVRLEGRSPNEGEAYEYRLDLK